MENSLNLINSKIEELEKKLAEAEQKIHESMKNKMYEYMVDESKEAYMLQSTIELLEDLKDEIGELIN